MTAMVRLALAALLFVGTLVPAVAVERILLFVSDVSVQANGDLVVTETIRVQAEGQVIRRGILRDFPTVYNRPDGSRVEVGFKVESVMRDGQPENFVNERLSNGVRVRIGKADVELPNGPHEYVIAYRTTRQIGFFADKDELYWNATGNGWTFAIDQAEARIKLPAAVPFKQSAFYTGPQGAQGKDGQIVEQQNGRIVFRTTKPLPPNNGFTVGVAWEKGIVLPPTGARNAALWVEDNRPLVWAAAGLLLVLLYYAFAWMRVGRDPPGGTIIPLFAPPKGMSAAAVRYVDRMGFDDRCFASAVIDLGVSGHLKIVSAGKTSTVEQASGGREVAPQEHAMESTLFASHPSIVLTQTNHEVLGAAKKALKDGLSKTYLGNLFRNNYAWSGLGLFLVVLLLAVVVVIIGMDHRNLLLAGFVVGGAFAVPVAMGGAALIFNGLTRMFAGWTLTWGVILFVAAAIGWLVMVWANTDGGALDLVLTGLFLVAAAVAGIGFPLLKAPSPTGRKVMDEIEGFRQYLGVAEEDRLNALNPPNKTPELFERFLPYAIALDVQNVWAKRFAGVLAAAGAAAVAHQWYESDRDWNDPVDFADRLGGELSQTISSASTAPGSSDSGGSSGGGSSGGGGGGGGGSGW